MVLPAEPGGSDLCLMSGVLSSSCCCDQDDCGLLASLSCSYLVSGLGGDYYYKKFIDLSCYDGECLGDRDTPSRDFEFEFAFSATQIGSATLTRYGTSPYCYVASGNVSITGTLTFAEKIQDPQGTYSSCTNSFSISFSSEAPFCYTLTCGSGSADGCTWDASGPIFNHNLSLCDFPISTSQDFFYQPTCSTGGCTGLLAWACAMCQGCPTEPHGIVCQGGNFNWISRLKDPRYIGSDERGKTQPCYYEWCGPAGHLEEEGCYPDVNDNEALNGPFAIHKVDEFTDDDGPDPWVPCSLTPATTEFGPKIIADGDPDKDPCTTCGNVLWQSDPFVAPCLTCDESEIRQSWSVDFPSYS